MAMEAASWVELRSGEVEQRFQPTNDVNNPPEYFDYIEEEWFVTGEADSGHYATAVLVRRPRDQARFSGTILVEPLRIQSRIAAVSTYTAPYIMRSGHGWAMIVSQKLSLDADVKPTNPSRYASLDIPADPDAPGADDPASVDILRPSVTSHTILAQVGAALRGPNGPFSCYNPRHIILTGHSQTGKVTSDFLLEVHESQRLAGGAPVFDGFYPAGFPTKPLSNADVPVVQVLSEADIAHPDGLRGMSPGRAYRRGDSDDPSDRYRLYELAGHPHSGTRYPPTNSVKFWQTYFQSIGVNVGIPQGASMSSLATFELFRMSLHHLIQWVSKGVAPPRAQRIETGADDLFVKDEHGHSRGGVRCAQLDVPRATHIIAGPIAFEEPFDKPKLRSLYVSHADYVAKFNARLDELIAQRLFLDDDAPEFRDESKNTVF
jgi:hypothetical protein